MTVKEMRDRRGKCAEEMSALALNLTLEGNQAKFDAYDAEQNGLKKNIESAERAAALELELRGSARPPENQPLDAPEAATKKYDAAFRSYLKYGWNARPDRGIIGISDEHRSLLTPRRQKVEISPEEMARFEHRDMGSGGQGAYPGATTGFFVPLGFENRIEEALKYYGDMLNQAEVMPTATGQPLPFPTDNDTTVMGELVGEGQQVSTADVALNQIVLGAYKFSTKLVKVSIELLQDSAFDIESFLVKKFSIRLGRILNNKFTVGSGTNEPKGIITASTVGLSSATTPVLIGNDNLVTPDPTTQIGYIDMVNLLHSVDPAYRQGAKYMFHDQTLRYLKTLKDLYGRPLWVPGMAANVADTINGYGYSINNDMATLATGQITAAFGLLSKYLVRKVKDLAILRLEERFADYGQVAFIGFARYDGNLLDAGTHPVKYAKQN